MALQRLGAPESSLDDTTQDVPAAEDLPRRTLEHTARVRFETDPDIHQDRQHGVSFSNDQDWFRTEVMATGRGVP